MTRRVHGPVGAVGAITEDGRRIDPEALTVLLGGGATSVRLSAGVAAPLEVSLLALDRPGDGHDGARLVGKVTRAWIAADGLVNVEGVAVDELPPGEYGCGMDLADVSDQLVDAAGDLIDLERMFQEGGSAPEVVVVTTAARLAAVTVYLPGATARPAFSVARLTVETDLS